MSAITGKLVWSVYPILLTKYDFSINPDHFGGYQANIELTKKKKNVRIPRAASSTGGASLEVRAKINKQMEKTHRNKFRKWGVIDFHRCKYLLLLGQRFK